MRGGVPAFAVHPAYSLGGHHRRPGQRVDQRRLARTRRSEQRQRATGGDPRPQSRQPGAPLGAHRQHRHPRRHLGELGRDGDRVGDQVTLGQHQQRLRPRLPGQREQPLDPAHVRLRMQRLLLTTFVLQALATGCMLAGVDYLATDVLGRKGAGTILFVCFVGPALVLTPAWAALGTRIGKKRGYLLASLVLAAGAALAGLAQSAPAGVLYAATFLVGVGYAGCQVFPLAMLPDAAAVDARRTGSNRAGVYTGVWTAGETLGLALGPGVFALVLALGGYRSSTSGDVVQPDSALTAIVLGFSVLPALLTLVSLAWLARYSLDAEEVDR